MIALVSSRNKSKWYPEPDWILRLLSSSSNFSKSNLYLRAAWHYASVYVQYVTKILTSVWKLTHMVLWHLLQYIDVVRNEIWTIFNVCSCRWKLRSSQLCNLPSRDICCQKKLVTTGLDWCSLIFETWFISFSPEPDIAFVCQRRGCLVHVFVSGLKSSTEDRLP